MAPPDCNSFPARRHLARRAAAAASRDHLSAHLSLPVRTAPFSPAWARALVCASPAGASRRAVGTNRVECARPTCRRWFIQSSHLFRLSSHLSRRERGQFRNQQASHSCCPMRFRREMRHAAPSQRESAPSWPRGPRRPDAPLVTSRASWTQT